LSKTGEGSWSPAFTIETMVHSIRSLLADLSSGSLANQDAGHLFASNPAEFDKYVRQLIKSNGQFNAEAAAGAGAGAGGAGGGAGGAASGGSSKQKYLKYKEKYLNLKNQLGGASNSAMGITRISKELKIVKKGIPGFKLTHVTETVWHGVLEGPSGTPYEGCRYPISIDFFGKGNYPTNPPSITFIGMPPWHVNVYRNGAICIDILNSAWSPALQIASIMPSLQSLLSEPNPSSPANSEANPTRAGFAEKVKSDCAKNTELLKSEYFSGVAMGEAVAAAGGAAGGAGTHNKYLNIFNWF
jgi:ubiquitin-protein ligase